MRAILLRATLKEWLISNNYTQARFAAEIGVHPQMLSAYVGGDAQPSARTRAEMLRVTGLDFPRLFTLERTPEWYSQQPAVV